MIKVNLNGKTIEINTDGIFINGKKQTTDSNSNMNTNSHSFNFSMNDDDDDEEDSCKKHFKEYKNKLKYKSDSILSKILKILFLLLFIPIVTAALLAIALIKYSFVLLVLTLLASPVFLVFYLLLKLIN